MSWERKTAPVFVVGCPRSGTTFLYDTLLSSGNFALFQAESDVFSMLAPAFGDLRSKSNRVELMDVWLRSDYFKRSGLDSEVIRSEILADCRSAGDFLRIVMNQIANNQSAERWADNTPAHLLYMPQIKAQIPNALFVHIIRDGRDVATSMNKIGWQAEHGRFPWDRQHGLLVSGTCWEWLVRRGRAYGRRLGLDYLEIHYEHLVQRPAETLKKLGEFIHHDFDLEYIKQHPVGTVRIPNSSFTAGKPSTAGQSSTKDDVDAAWALNPIGRWKGVRNPDAARLDALLAPLLLELKYEVKHSPPLDFTTWRIRVFYFFYRELKLALKKSSLSKFVTCRDHFRPGYLDQQASRWVGLIRPLN